MKACYAIQRTCAVLLFLIKVCTTENSLGYLSVRNPVFDGGNITLILIPFHQTLIRDFHDLKLQVLFKHKTTQQEIYGAPRPFENGKAVFMEISNVDKTWNNSAVYFIYNNNESNRVNLQINDRMEGFLHVLSYPSQLGDSAQIAFYPPVGFQDWKQMNQWWTNRYGGNVNDANKEEIIFTITIANRRTFFLEYFYNKSPMNISVTVVSAHRFIGPLCSKKTCDYCVCAHLGGDFTCTTDGHMLAMWIGPENVEFEEIIEARHEEKQYRPHNFSITKHHHNSTIVCFIEKTGFVFNNSATLIVLDAVQSVISQDSSTALTYALVFTSVFIVAVISSVILVKRMKRSKITLLGFCRAGRRVATRAQDIDQEDTLSGDDHDDFDSDVSDKGHKSERAKFPNEEPTGANVTLVYADLDIECLEQGPPSAPTAQKYEPTQYVEFKAYRAEVTESGNIKTEVTEYGNINMIRQQDSLDFCE